MPPKVKKIDPELQKAQFEEWKEKDEYRVWAELQVLSKGLYDISETTFDLTGNWQIYHDKLLEVAQVFKVKTKLKEIQHAHIRSAFFAVEDVEINKTVVKQYLDGFYYSVEKIDKDRGTHVKSLFSKIFRTLEDHKFFEMTPETYMADKKNLVTLLNDFFKKLPILIKMSHKIIEEKLMLVSAPLRNLLEINKKLMFFDLRNTNSRDRQVRQFMLKVYIFTRQADVDVYCVCLQECQRLLYESKEKEREDAEEKRVIQFNPQIKLIFNKLAIEGWAENKIESFYLLPLQQAFDKMRNNLLCLMIKGINFYKTPIKENKQFVEDLKAVINAELIAEHLLGNPLKRDQLNFTFDVLSVIFNANQLSKEFLLKKDENCVKGSVPKLVAYHTILRMRKWLDRKLEQEIKKKKEEAKQNLGQAPNTQQLPQGSPQQEELAVSSYMSPEKKRHMDEEQKKREEQLKQAEEINKSQALLDEQEFGRYWIWENYCTKEYRDIFEECVERVRHINPAVQQDIEDNIIKEGMIPRHKDKKVKENDPTQVFNEFRKKDYANQYVIQRRPPELWNFPKITEEKHEFRAIAEPKKCYIDGRIEELEAKIELLGQHLEQNRVNGWYELINRVIDALKQTYSVEPTLIDVEL